MLTLLWDCHRNNRLQFTTPLPHEIERRLFFIGMKDDKVLLHEPWQSATNSARDFVPSQYHLARIVRGEIADGLLPAGTVLEIVQSRTVQDVKDAGGTGSMSAFQEEA